jgi:hypothetical protein
MLTLRLMEGSVVLIADGDEQNFMDSGELLWRESAKLARCGPPLDVLLLSDDNQGLALLLDYCLSSVMVIVISHDMNSGGVL